MNLLTLKTMTFTAKLLLLPLIFGLAGSLQGAEPSPAGKWMLRMYRSNGQLQKNANLEVVLRLDDGKLTGTTLRRLGGEKKERPILNGSFEDGIVKFCLPVTDPNDVACYSGKVEGDTMTGEFHYLVNGQPRTRKWKATRSLDGDSENK